MAQFSSSYLDELISRTDLVEIIARHVDLKASGSNMMGLCPFHNEKSASFSVSVDKQIYYCFGCGKGGNAYRFLMEHDGYAFPEAVEFLAHKAGMAIPASRAVNPGEEARKKRGLALLAQVAGVFARTLQADEGAKATLYLEQRQLPLSIIQRYQLGFSPAGYGFMQRCFGDDKDMLQQLEGIGVLVRNERGYADRFRGRVMFPIRDKRGEVVGFGGRVMGDGEPKYLNSPETDFYHKSNLLYGYSEHRDAIRKRKMLVVVEGYMDVLAMAAFDLPYAVAPLGTAITEPQLRLILRLEAAPIFCFDGDKAGRQAAWRAIERMLGVLKAEHNPRFLYLPDGEDPDTLLKKEGQAAFEQRLEQDALPALDAWLKGLQLISGEGASGRAMMAKKAEKMLSGMGDDYLRQAWQSEVEKASGVALTHQKGNVLVAKPRAVKVQKRARGLAVSPLKHDRFMAGLLQKHARFSKLNEDAFEFFVDSDPAYPIYTRAFSLVGIEESTILDIAAQLMREFPDNHDIARWVNLPTVEDDEFDILLIDMQVSYLDDLLRSRSLGLAVKIRLQAELTTLKAQQKLYQQNQKP
ncbi:MAG: DNA primase [Mariprofundaceae bacterium]|nr:DNA primase [Mariprofundaceae bacterium]